MYGKSASRTPARRRASRLDGVERFVEGFLYTVAYNFLNFPLDHFLIELYNLFRYGLPSPFRRRYFILPEFCKPCLFLSLFHSAQLIAPYRLSFTNIRDGCKQNSLSPSAKNFTNKEVMVLFFLLRQMISRLPKAPADIYGHEKWSLIMT